MPERLRQNDFPGGSLATHENQLGFLELRVRRMQNRPVSTGIPIPLEFQNNLERMIITSDGMLCITSDGKSHFTPDEELHPDIRKRVQQGRKAHIGE